MERDFSIRQVAVLTGLSVHTLRYYEQIGLLDAVERAESGHRRYTSADVTWIEFLLRLRATGMSVQQMCLFADLRREGSTTVHERRLLLESHFQQVQERIRTLEQHAAQIAHKIKHYHALENAYDHPTTEPHSSESTQTTEQQPNTL